MLMNEFSFPNMCSYNVDFKRSDVSHFNQTCFTLVSLVPKITNVINQQLGGTYFNIDLPTNHSFPCLFAIYLEFHN
uniref:Uncharacterized protein n=1 Tax=Anguilla anguilla TaxID=7936 RepID=A0A0E9SHM8_ANGAN